MRSVIKKKYMQKTPMTPKEYKMLDNELNFLKNEKHPKIQVAIQEARALGDLSENAEYHAAKEEQGMIQARLQYLENLLTNATVIDISNLSGDTVIFGATVTIFDEETEKTSKYKIVGIEEADPAKGLIPFNAPLSKALMGKKQGETIEFTSPKGLQEFTVEKVEFI